MNTKVCRDFQIRCYRQGAIEAQVGETCCLNTAFIEDNYIRVKLNKMLKLDVIFESCPIVPQSYFQGEASSDIY